MAESTNKKQDIYLLGQRLKTAILGNKLPAKGEVMRRFLYIHLSEKMTVRDNLFDIAHANAIELIQIQEERKFLLAQREPERRGYMSGVDKNLALKEARSYERKRRQENYKLKSVQAQEEITAGACSAEIEHSSSDSSSKCESEEDSIVKRVQVKLLDVPSTLCTGVEKLLSVPKLESGTGERQATEVHECLLEWNLEESVKALVFDTTASNTGKKNGACTLLQQKLGRNFLLTRVEEKGICRFIVFGICVYLRSWFTAPDLLSAARHDLQLVKKIQQFRDVDREVSVAAANALSRHLWYVSENLLELRFSMIRFLMRKKVQMNINDISDEMSVKDFVSSNTMQFFAILGLPHSFLNKRPSEWKEDEQYKKAFEVVSGIKPVNDFAERGVALMQDFNRAIVSSEEQKQYLLQIYAGHIRIPHHAFPNRIRAFISAESTLAGVRHVTIDPLRVVPGKSLFAPYLLTRDAGVVNYQQVFNIHHFK
ncbi:hypothetical protein HELRODRAFT_164040 [Helobdella robusta]|uniref:Uncharacterized protein n=1 Tax=Helobdella robusta TaxID=6412 RepID=T1EUT3_HELRO|nr:hypothetical protein HELRODRAFT_164040 [Helobdella robusta]ESN94235.1 hypothetical protein HELRODRAFT_164040 [Helobdella robusta]